MAKGKRKAIALRSKITPEQARFRRRVSLNVLAIMFLAVGAAVGYFKLRTYVEQRLAFPSEAPRVVLKNRPVWMTDFLADQIIEKVQPPAARSALDQRMLVAVCEILKTNPWIKEVKQVRRAYGKKPGDTIEVDCEYRAPIALVQYGQVYALVDAEGVKLPELFSAGQLPRIMFGENGRVNIRVIEGVAKAPPETGRKWVSEDLSAGLEMVQLLYGKPYAEEILSVKVSNYGGRVDAREAWIVLVTRDKTEIMWGRPKSAGDAFVEIPWYRKLDRMQRIVETYHRIDAGHSAVELRFDRTTLPETQGERERSAGLRESP
jgi:hypothetical protein